MDFSGNALAPNVLLIKQHLAELCAERHRAGAQPLNYRFPARRSRQSHTFLLADEEETASLQAGFGFGPFLDPDARALVLSPTQDFVSIYPKTCASSFVRAGLIGAAPLSIYAVSPFVMLVDRASLGSRPLPRHWSDLLDPCYQGEVVITAEDPTSNVALLSYFRLFGEEGLRAFISNISASASASVMSNLCAHASSQPGSIYIIPWFFARCCAAQERVVMVWPEEGALCFPLWLALRRDASEGARFIAAYFTGEEFARESAQSCLPAAHAASDEVLEEAFKTFLWVGWDFLQHMDIAAYASLVNADAAHIQKVSTL